MPDSVNRGQWTKGQSGNPNGRPPRERALADMLRTIGDFDSYAEAPNKRLLAQMVWEGLICGSIQLVGGRSLDLTLREWLELLKWLHQHVDGTLATTAGVSAADDKPPKEPPRGFVMLYGPEEKTLHELEEEYQAMRDRERAAQVQAQAQPALPESV